MSFALAEGSLKRLEGVHPDLVKVVKRCIEITPIDFKVLCGTRTIEEQKVLVRNGKSKTMNSRHLTGHAVDLVPLPVDWDDVGPFRKLAVAMKEAASQLNIDIVWGGDWPGGWDKPHFELDRKVYP